MTKTFTSKAIAALAFVALASSLLLTPMQASARLQSQVSQGGGVKCYLILASYDPATASSVWTRVCGKVGV